MSGIFPRDVVIVRSKNEWGHHYPVGSTVTVISTYSDAGVWAEGVADFGIGPEEAEQVIRFEDFAEIAVAQEVKTPAKTPEKLVAKRVKMLYTVQDSDGDIIFFTQDRALAREVKAVEGGKANGIVIMQYGELKEIR